LKLFAHCGLRQTRSRCHRNQAFNNQYNAFTVHRAKFDPWFAKLAEDAGAVILNRTTAEGVVKENGRVVGVKTERGDVLADVVIAADGVNSMLSKQAGLREELPPDSVVLAVKEVIALPKQRIEERFNRIKRMKATLFKRRSRVGLLRDFYNLWRLFS